MSGQRVLIRTAQEVSSGLRPEFVSKSPCAVLDDLAQALSRPCACVSSATDFLFLLPVHIENFFLWEQVYDL